LTVELAGHAIARLLLVVGIGVGVAACNERYGECASHADCPLRAVCRAGVCTNTCWSDGPPGACVRVDEGVCGSGCCRLSGTGSDDDRPGFCELATPTRIDSGTPDAGPGDGGAVARDDAGTDGGVPVVDAAPPATDRCYELTDDCPLDSFPEARIWLAMDPELRNWGTAPVAPSIAGAEWPRTESARSELDPAAQLGPPAAPAFFGDGDWFSYPGDFAVDFWVRTETDLGTVWDQGASTGGLLIGVGLGDVPGGQVGVFHYDRAAGGGAWLAGETSVADGEWHHVIVVRIQRTLAIHVDGRRTAARTIEPEAITQAQLAWVGYYEAAEGRELVADLDELRVWAR